MKSHQKITRYPSKNKKTETYKEGNTSVTLNYYDTTDSDIKEFISLSNGITQIKHITLKGVVSKLEHFEKGKREGIETKYFISKADGSIKSTKMYSDGKLNGDNITYNEIGDVIKHEIFSEGKKIS